MTRLAALAVLTAGGFSVIFSAGLVFKRGDSRGLLLSSLGMMLIWVAILIDREARARQSAGASRSLELSSPRVPALITQIIGLCVLMLGGFLLVACLAHYFSGEPMSWLGLANSPIAVLVIWLGLVIDRDRLREEGRRRREREGLRDADDPD